MIKTDLHIHSIVSGHAFNTFDEIVNYSEKNKYLMIGISDHGSNMNGAPTEGYFEMGKRLPKQIGSLKILFGCEANILNINGELDLEQNTLKSLDYVMAGLHRRTAYNGNKIEENTNAIVSSIQSGLVDVITHPFTNVFPADIKKIVDAASAYNVALELNKSILLHAIASNDQKLIEQYQLMALEAKLKNVVLIFGSDAHHISEMRISSKELNSLLSTLNIHYCDIINSSQDAIIEFLSNRRERSII